MIVPKHPEPDKVIPSEVDPSIGVLVSHTQLGTKVTVEEAYEVNPLVDIFNALREILSTIKVDERDENSPSLFRTIQIENGQVDRILNKKENTEYAIPFPAVFIHFININWLVNTGNIGEGRGECRIKVVMNTLNNSDKDEQTEMYRVFQRVNRAINDNKEKWSALTKRFQLTYFDPMESMPTGLQYFWITYEVHFQDYTAATSRNYVERHLVVPPYTNHSDQDDENNDFEHEDHTEVTVEDVVHVVDRLE